VIPGSARPAAGLALTPAIRGPNLLLGHPGNAAELAGEGVPLHVVQAQFGHSNLAVTSRYVSHLQPQAVVDAMQARRWE
jgi:integrase